MSSRIIYSMGSNLSAKNASFAYTLIDRHLRDASGQASQIIWLENLRTILLKETREDVSSSLEMNLRNDINEIITFSLNKNTAFSFVNIYLKNGFTFSSSGIELPYDDYQGCIRYHIDNGYINEGYNPSTWCEVVPSVDRNRHGYYALINFRVLYHPATYQDAGVLITAIDERNLRSQYASYYHDAMIMHGNGQIVSGADMSMLGMNIHETDLYNRLMEHSGSAQTLSYSDNGVTRMISYSKQPGGNLYYIIPFEYYSGNELSEMRQFYNSGFFIILGGLILAICAAMWISSGLFQSVKKVKNIIETVQAGDLSARYQSAGRDEIAYLGNSFNSMLDTLHENYETRKEQERINNRIELNLMQAQINPHLLYNTLDSVLWAMKNDSREKAEHLLIRLSQFFKISLFHGSDIMPLSRELDLIRNYIDIQRLARGKRYMVNFNIPDEMLPLEIPKLLIQPIVENAIIHGFSGFRDDGIIDISVPVNRQQIIVRDNGIGVAKEALDDLNVFLNTYPPPIPNRSFGLYNVNRRIKNIYGTQYGIELESEPGAYFQVSIYIPGVYADEGTGEND
ncbi:MAG: histidine kinase [Oscillospiraceae bacterium]|nr:histidine kinase [Oscillospiraceae bacterium]